MNEFLDTLYVYRYMLLVGPAIGAMCALLSVYVVLRRMALISEGVSHAAFGGISLAVLLGYFFPVLDPTYLNAQGLVERNHAASFWWEVIAGVFCVATALLMGYITRRKRVTEDSAIGIFLVTSVALGQVLITIRRLLPPIPGRQIPVDLEGLLFGQFAAVDGVDLLVVTGALIVIAGVIALLYHQFLYTTLDEEMARVNGVNTRLINTLLLVMISLVIVVCVRMVGSLIITALMIIPGATANLLSRRFGGVLFFSLLVGTLGTSAATGLAMVPPLDRFTTGPLIVLMLFIIFAIVWIARQLFKPAASRPSLPHDDPPDTTAEPRPPSSFGHGH